MVDEYLAGRNVVRISRLKTGPPSGDWVTIGVVKSAAQKCGSNGASYSILLLTDLHGADLLLFLFGTAQEKHWGQFGGTVVAVLSPKFKENATRATDDVPAYSIKHDGQFMVLGKSKDFGLCKSLRRDGQPCQNVSPSPLSLPWCLGSRDSKDCVLVAFKPRI
jgi:hypothetical protein